MRTQDTADVSLEKLIQQLALVHKELAKQPSVGTLNLLDESNVAHKESVHSNLLAFLLESSRAHRHPEYGEQFLQMLSTEYPQIQLKSEQPFSVITEQWIALDTDTEPEEWGRLDLLLESEAFIIAIENKIWAKDREGQLENYYEWLQREGRSKNKRYVLLYLTPYGEYPNECSMGRKEVTERIAQGSVALLSYSIHIVSWLKKLQTKENEVMLSASLSQYRESIERMCGERKEDEMEVQTVIQTLRDQTEGLPFETLSAYRTLSGHLETHYTLFSFVSFLRSIVEVLCKDRSLSNRIFYTHAQKKYDLDRYDQWLTAILEHREDIGVALQIDHSDAESASIGLELESLKAKANLYLGIMLHGRGDGTTSPVLSLEMNEWEDYSNEIETGDAVLWGEYIRIHNFFDRLCESEEKMRVKVLEMITHYVQRTEG